MIKKNNIVISFIVEIPKGSSNKYEYDIKNKIFSLDRVLYGANFYPGEYGFIENTLDWDGDPLDVICLNTYPTIPGCRVNARILGTIDMIDDGEIDTKLIGVFHDDPRWNHIQTLNDIPKHIKEEITNFFLQYKTLQKKNVVIESWSGINKAIDEIKSCTKRYEEYKDVLYSKGIDEVKKNMKRKKTSKIIITSFFS